MHGRILSSIPGLCPPAINSTQPRWDNQECLQTPLTIPRGWNCLVRTRALLGMLGGLCTCHCTPGLLNPSSGPVPSLWRLQPRGISSRQSSLPALNPPAQTGQVPPLLLLPPLSTTVIIKEAMVGSGSTREKRGLWDHQDLIPFNRLPVLKAPISSYGKWRTSLAGLWLRLCAPSEGGTGSRPTQGRSTCCISKKKENESDTIHNTIHNKVIASYSVTSFLQSPRTASGTY